MKIQCQEEVSNNNHSYKRTDKAKSKLAGGDKTHQCKHKAKYLIKNIDLHVCRTHSAGVDEDLLIPI